MRLFKHKFRQIKKFPTWIYFFPATLLRLYRMTMHIKFIDEDKCVDIDKLPFITVTWHNRLLLLPLVFTRPFREKSYAVISASRDGQYLADLIGYFGVKTLRGSSSRKGMNVLLGGQKVLKEKCNICFTPDGPRGPKYQMSKGPVFLARTMNCPILPIAINASSYWQLKSWDNFQIPKPFCKVTVVLGKPIPISSELTDEELESCRQEAEAQLRDITQD